MIFRSIFTIILGLSVSINALGVTTVNPLCALKVPAKETYSKDAFFTSERNVTRQSLRFVMNGPFFSFQLCQDFSDEFALETIGEYEDWECVSLTENEYWIPIDEWEKFNSIFKHNLLAKKAENLESAQNSEKYDYIIDQFYNNVGLMLNVGYLTLAYTHPNLKNKNMSSRIVKGIGWGILLTIGGGYLLNRSAIEVKEAKIRAIHLDDVISHIQEHPIGSEKTRSFATPDSDFAMVKSVLNKTLQDTFYAIGCGA